MTTEAPAWFKHDIPAHETAEHRQRREQIEREIEKLLKHQERPGRANSFQPYLLVRSVLGDRGDRPINVTFWESPDIWTAPGDPSETPAVPANHGGTAVAGKPTTLYAHVWNLGLAPLAGIQVEFYWFDPSLSFHTSNAHQIGMARCELSGRGMAGSHKLVKCPKPWVPVMANGGHECLVVRTQGIGDPIGANEWFPWMNRHVAQRNISVVPAGANVAKLIQSLNLNRLAGARLQLLQISAAQGELARYIAAPELRLSKLQTHVLGEIDINNNVIRGAHRNATAAMLAPVHPLAAEKIPTPPEVRRTGKVKVIDPAAMLGIGGVIHEPSPPPQPQPVGKAQPASALGLHQLLTSIAELQLIRKDQGRPAPNEAHALRIASYDGDQLVGGYTLLVKGE